MPILKTRLFKPPVSGDLIARDRLISLFETNQNKPLTLVVASTGYGKSILVSQWLDKIKSAYCWISLEKDCNDLRIFLKYIASCIHSKFPEAFLKLSDMLEAAELPDVDIISATFTNELYDLNEEIKIILDDYHLIQNKDIHYLIGEILQHPPDKVRMIIISRVDPPLRIDKLRLYDQVAEIRMRDLKFSKDEIIQFSKIVNSFNVDDTVAQKIYDISEGWIIGVKLLFRRVSGGGDAQATLENISGESLEFGHYLMNEILKNEGFIRQDFLLKASLFDRFSVEMIELLTSTTASGITINDDYHAEINDLVEKAMFIIPLDEDKQWLRFHHLIKDFLYSQAFSKFSSAQINQFYCKASEYYEKQEYFEEAIEYAVKGDAVDQAVRIINTNGYRLQEMDNMPRLIKWLSCLPAGTIETNPGLLLLRAYVYDSVANWKAWGNDLEMAIRVMNNSEKNTVGSELFWGEYYCLKGRLANVTGDIETFGKSMEKALNFLEGQINFSRSVSVGYYALYLQVSGDGTKGLKLINNYLDEIRDSHRLNLMHIHLFQSYVFTYRGELEHIILSAKVVLQISAEEKAYGFFVKACYYISGSNYVLNNLEEAIEYSGKIRNYQFSSRANWTFHVYITHAFSLFAQGKMKEYNAFVEEMKIFVSNSNERLIKELFVAFEVEMALRQKNVPLAERLHPNTGYEPHPIIYSFYFPQLTRVKLLMFGSKLRDMAEAKRLLDYYVIKGEDQHNDNFLIQVYALLAIWLKMNGNNAEALISLRKSVFLGIRGDYIRTYTDLGEDMKNLIEAYPAEQAEMEYLSKIKSAFLKESLIHTNNVTYAEEVITDIAIQFNLRPKELEILHLVARGYQNKKIADTLYLSPNTIRKYLFNLFQKLEVNNRTQAAQKAKELNLI